MSWLVLALPSAFGIQTRRATWPVASPKTAYISVLAGWPATLRYDTPVGPLRVDVGYRIPGAQVMGEPIDPRIEGDPGTVFGVPIAVALGIGEAF